MIAYNGKAKCSCGKRGKWKAMNGSQNLFACNEHKTRLARFSNPEPDNERVIEADYEIWAWVRNP